MEPDRLSPLNAGRYDRNANVARAGKIYDSTSSLGDVSLKIHKIYRGFTRIEVAIVAKNCGNGGNILLNLLQVTNPESTVNKITLLTLAKNTMDLN